MLSPEDPVLTCPPQGIAWVHPFLQARVRGRRNHSTYLPISSLDRLREEENITHGINDRSEMVSLSPSNHVFFDRTASKTPSTRTISFL